jgi:ACS family tartrate transporter-like MFS transporter
MAQRVTVEDVVHKLWGRIIPLLFILYIIAFFDRTNIGFTIVPMHQELGFSYEALGLASGIFFIGYFIFQMPGTYLVDKVGAKLIIAIFLAGWGIFAILVGTVTNIIQLYVYRFMVGFMEGAFFPGVIYYLSLWFPQKWRAQAVVLFTTAIPISTIINGPLAGYIITTLGWRWVFYIEGLLAVIFAPIAYALITNRPVDAKWLAEDEKRVLLERLRAEAEEAAKRAKQSIGSALANPVTIILALIYFFSVSDFYAINIWTPVIIKLATPYGYLVVGVIVAIIWIIGLIWMVLWGRHSDRTLERIHHTAVSLILGAVGAAIAVAFPTNFAALFIGLVLITMGTLGVLGPFWSLPTMYLTGAVAAVAIGFINSIGNLGGFSGPYIVGYAETATHSFVLAYIIIIIFFIIAAALVYSLKLFRQVQIEQRT